MFNVQSKTNWKSVQVNGKTKKKDIEQSGVYKWQSGGRGGAYGGKDLRKRYLLSLEWKRVGVMDNDSGDDETDELREFG